jgi:hypothetical protein
MQRVAYFKPRNGEVACTTESAIAEHLMRHIAKLNIEATFATEQCVCRSKQLLEYFLALLFVGIYSASIDSALGKEVGGDNPSAISQDYHHVGSNGTVIVERNKHIWCN